MHRPEVYYKVKYKPYRKFIGIVGDRKMCTDNKTNHITMEEIPDKEKLKFIVSGMIDKRQWLVFGHPHRIKDHELDLVEIVKFETE